MMNCIACPEDLGSMSNGLLIHDGSKPRSKAITWNVTPDPTLLPIWKAYLATDRNI